QRLSHVLGIRAGGRYARRHVQLPRHDGARAARRLEEPRGRSDTPFMGWLQRHDAYDGLPGQGSDEAGVRELIADWAAAVRAKDIDRALSHYAADVVAFDLAPPLQYVGREALRKSLATSFATFQGAVDYEIRNPHITVGHDVPLCRNLHRISGRRTNGPDTDVWMRATIRCRKMDGRWFIMHEHTSSVPFYMDGSD